MLTSFLPVLLFVIAAGLLSAGLLVLGAAIGPSKSGRVKEMPYEAGMDPIHDTRRRFDVRFYLVAIAFLVFDVELLFLYPWAVASRSPEGIDRVAGPIDEAGNLISGRQLVFGEAMVFIGLLAAGYVYAWRKGVFRWR